MFLEKTINYGNEIDDTAEGVFEAVAEGSEIWVEAEQAWNEIVQEQMIVEHNIVINEQQGTAMEEEKKKGFIQTIKDFFKKIYNKVKEWVQKVVQKIKDFFKKDTQWLEDNEDKLKQVDVGDGFKAKVHPGVIEPTAVNQFNALVGAMSDLSNIPANEIHTAGKKLAEAFDDDVMNDDGSLKFSQSELIEKVLNGEVQEVTVDTKAYGQVLKNALEMQKVGKAIERLTKMVDTMQKASNNFVKEMEGDKEKGDRNEKEITRAKNHARTGTALLQVVSKAYTKIWKQSISVLKTGLNEKGASESATSGLGFFD